MRLVTNFLRFPEKWEAANGMRGSSIQARSTGDYWRLRGPDTVWLVNCDTRQTLELAALKMLPGAPVLIAADLVLRSPTHWRGRMTMPFRRFLLSRVDHFILYFRDLRGYQHWFGIGAERCSFVPFKVNLVDRYSALEAVPGGEYVLCIGRSMRDFDTFFDAIEQLPYPAAITTPEPALFKQHGARFTRSIADLPKNIRILEDDGTDESLMRIVKDAKMVVLPVLKSSLVASGISTALNVMMLGKCVVGSAGPGMPDVFADEVLIAPPEDAGALAATIRRAWEDDDLRMRTAAAGLRYARLAGGEPELYQRIIDQVAAAYSK